MVGLLFQAITNKQMVCFLYRGMKRYVTPLRIESTANGVVLYGREGDDPLQRKYKGGEMIGVSLVADPTVPEARRHTPWMYGELEEELPPEEKDERDKLKIATELRMKLVNKYLPDLKATELSGDQNNPIALQEVIRKVVNEAGD